MIENLQPDSIDTLRELYRAVYAERPVLLYALARLLDAIEALWDEQGTPARTADRLDAEMLPLLPLLLELADMSVSGPSPEEEAIAHVIQEWRRIEPTLERP